MKVISHPNGFLRITFSNEADGSQERLHVWDVSGYEDGDIHQHGSDFTSTIIEGVMVEELYEAIDDEDGDYERWTVECRVDDAGNYYVDEFAPRVRCRAQLKELVTHNPGETYVRTASYLHKVIAAKSTPDHPEQCRTEISARAQHATETAMSIKRLASHPIQ